MIISSKSITGTLPQGYRTLSLTLRGALEQELLYFCYNSLFRFNIGSVILSDNHLFGFVRVILSVHLSHGYWAKKERL